MGKVDQGVVVLWMANHFFKKPISYIGFGGKGKQVRDVIHVDDLFDLLKIQIENMDEFNGSIQNVGGGLKNSISLIELTNLCEEISGNKVSAKSVDSTRPGDVKSYISDNSKIQQECEKLAVKWIPKKDIRVTLMEIHKWIGENKDKLSNILG